jgi:hypothetical protein
LFVLALLILAATLLFPAIIRALGSSGEGEPDRARLLLACAVCGLPPDRAGWAQAMLVELDQVEGRRERWRFSLGCIWVALRLRARSGEPGGALLRVLVLGAATVSAALVGYGLVRYPGLRSEPTIGGAMTVFLATLFLYAAITILLARGVTQRASAARRYGLVGGIAVAAGWVFGIHPPYALKGWVFVPLLFALLGPCLVAALAERRCRESGAGIRAALWSGIVGGLTVFIIWVTATYVSNGGPYDPGLVRDFHTSGAHDLATYAVSDNLGSGLVLLLMVPTVALALGSMSARLAAATPRHERL